MIEGVFLSDIVAALKIDFIYYKKVFIHLYIYIYLDNNLHWNS